jgi:hypothetical protein
LSLSSASPLADRCPTWAIDERSAATSAQTTEEGLADGVLAAELPPDGVLAAEPPPDEQPAPSSAVAATRTTPASPALMPETLPRARARVVTRAGLLARRPGVRSPFHYDRSAAARDWANRQEVPPTELARHHWARAKAATAAGASTWRNGTREHATPLA